MLRRHNEETRVNLRGAWEDRLQPTESAEPVIAISRPDTAEREVFCLERLRAPAIRGTAAQVPGSYARSAQVTRESPGYKGRSPLGNRAKPPH